ncbi:MAG: LptF/LptG family permease [Ferruginibacter sp.]
MKKIDWYILKKYLVTFFFCLLLFTVIAVVIDISEKTDDFVKSKLPVHRIITDYYFGFIPRIDALLFPLFVFIAVIYFTSRLAARSEVIAILSSGVSFTRFMLPYFGGGLLLSAMLWGGYRYIVPNANKKWGAFQAQYIDPNFGAEYKDQITLKNFYFRMDSNTYVGIRNYDTVRKKGDGFFIDQFSGTRLVYNLRAQNFNWDTAEKKWNLTNVLERHINGKLEKNKSSAAMLVSYNFKPNDLRRDEYIKDQLPTPELDQFIKVERERGSEMLSTLLVEKYNRDAIPVSVFILTVIGASMSSRKIRGGSGLQILIGLVLSCFYILFSRFSLVFATKGNFTPLLAAWVPNIIFGMIAIYLFRRASR